MNESDQPSEAEQGQAKTAEVLFRRYWFPLSRRCRLILDSASAGDEVARLSLARLLIEQPDLDPQAEHLEALWRESTAQCLDRLSDRSFRDGAWLRNMERAARERARAEGKGETGETAAPGEPDPHSPVAIRRLLGPLLPRMGRKTRQIAIHHFLDRLDGDALGRLAGISPAVRQKRLDRLLAAAGDALAPLSDFDPAACPSALDLDRLLAGESQGLDAARQHLADHPVCAEAQAARRTEQEQALNDEAVAAGVESLLASLGRVGVADRRSATRLGARRVWVPALLAALGMGLLLLMLWPSPKERVPTVIDENGGFYLQVLVVEGPDSRRPYHPGEVISLGTKVAFRAGADRPIFVTLARVGETGLIEAIRSDGVSAWPLAAGVVIDLPFSYTLGPAGRYERIFALYCGSPKNLLSLPDMLSFAYQGGPDGRRDLRREWIGTPDKCFLRSVLLTRRMDPTDTPVGDSAPRP